jgi:trimeric autotransporter adhesin
MLKPVLFFSLFAASVGACSSSSSGSGASSGAGGMISTSSAALTGHVANGTGSDAADYGGPSAVQSTVSVAALTIDAAGNTTSIAEGAVTAGSYTLEVPVHDGPTIVEGLDSKGNVVVRAILEDALVAGKTVMVQPMTTESSVEAAVLLAMTQAGVLLSDIDLVGLRSRIDAATAMIVQGDAIDQVSDATADVHALAVAVLTAQMSQQASLAAALVNADAFAAAELAAADTLTAALDGSDGSAAQANAAFTAAIAALDGQFGLDVAAVSRAATNASASAQSAIAAVATSTPLTNAFDRAQAMIECVATTAAMVDAFTTATAPAAVMGQLATANADLIEQVGAATNTAGLASAFAAWRTAVRGTVTGATGLLATLFGDTLTATAAYTTTVTALMALDAPLETAISKSATASEDAAGAIDATTLAALTATAYATFDTGVQSAVTASTIVFTAGESALMTAVFVSSQARF